MKKRAIVIGATSGIGQEVAKLLAANGYEVGIAGRRTERLIELSKATPGIVAYRQIDVTHNEAPMQLNALINELGGMDLYFHSSGIGWENVALDPDKELKTVETNAMGFVRMVSAAYSATKRMQAHYLECLSQQARMRHLNIGITDIRPGFVATDLIAGSHFPLQLKAEDVARTIVRAIEQGREVVTIDWRYRLLVAAWQLIPRWLWVRLTTIK